MANINKIDAESEFKSNVNINKNRNKFTAINKNAPEKKYSQSNIKTINSKIFREETKLTSFTVKSTELHYFSEKEIEKISVCDITEPKFIGPHSLGDPRLGVIENNVPCGTCHKINKDCPGHCGRIKFPIRFLNPTCAKEALYVAQSLCNSCGMLILDDQTIEKNGINNLRDVARLKKFYELSVKSKCRNVIIENGKHTQCKANPIYYPSKIKGERVIMCDCQGFGKENSIAFEMPIDDLETIFDSISLEDLKKLGFENNHPKNFIMGSMLVIPPQARPPDIRDGQIKQDYLSNSYKDIISTCVNYNESLKTDKTRSGDETRDKIGRNLYLQVSKFIDSGSESALKAPTDPTVGIKQKLLRKDGYIRKFVMGKRVNFIYRSPAGPGPDLQFGEIGIPKFMREILTVEEKVTQYNIERIHKLYKKGHVSYLLYNGNIKEEKGLLLDTKDPELRKEYLPQIGDVVHRWLEEGDIGISNRQPTLHKYGFLGQLYVFHDDFNIKTHPSQTTPYNLDYDGDELNGHVIQSIQAQAECFGIANVKKNIMSDQSNRPAMGLIFNSPASAYLMTKYVGLINKKYWDECVSLLLNDERLLTLEKRLSLHNVPMYSGRALFSTLLPEDFYYCKKGLVIKNGVLVSGLVTKDHIGPSSNSILHVMNKMCKNDVICRFITEGQWILDWFIYWHGLSMGYSDCLGKNVKDITKLELAKARLNINLLDKEDFNYEKNVLTILANVTNVASKKAIENLDENNSFLILVKSKAKGSELNVAQIMGLLGQQNVNDKRPVMTMNGGKRSTTYYDVDDDDLEARGFISDNYLEGVNPGSYYFHLAASRENLVDTAVKTASVGDLHHRIGKVLEDVYITYNGCVADRNTIFQYSFSDGFDPKELIPTKSAACGEVYSFIDWETVIGKLNNDFETRNKL